MHHLNIAFIIPSLKANGPCIVCRDLAVQMIAHGHHCVVYYFDECGNLDFPCEMVRITMKTMIDFEQFDIVHSHEVRPNLYVLLHKPLKCHTKFVVTIHNYVWRDYRSTYGVLKGGVGTLIFLLSILRHDKKVCLSKDMMAYYSHILNSKRLAYVYNTRNVDFKLGVTKEDEQSILDFKKDNYLIGTFCRILKRKNLCLVFRALSLLPHYRFLVIGDGPDLELVKMQCRECQVEDRVLFLGARKEAYRYLPLMDIFAIPSQSEGFPLALLEAAAFGTKCVCSDIDIFKECFNDNEIVTFPLAHPEQLACKIVEAQSREELKTNIKEKFNDSYSPQAFYDDYIAIYSDLLKEF